MWMEVGGSKNVRFGDFECDLRQVNSFAAAAVSRLSPQRTVTGTATGQEFRDRHDDCPRRERKIPRPLTAEHDQLLQHELVRRNDLASNVLLLLRHTGMRIGECVDLSLDCLRAGVPGEWAIHVPLGKMKT
jgi:hypothetical protein